MWNMERGRGKMMFSWFLNLILFRLKSPCCNVYMKESFLDIEHDTLVHTCPNCGREWM